MTGRSPAGPLMHEHRVIERMIGVMQHQLDGIATEHRVDATTIDQVTDFIRTYADRCHHGKEEDILFARLADKPLTPELAKDMQGLIEDHARGRVLTRELVEANQRYREGDEPSLETIANKMTELVEFYPVHIAKEDRHFFKPALECFDEAERTRMLADFDEFERQLLHEKYEGVVAALEAAS